MSIKEQLYYLIKHVKLGNYDINTFCDMFTNLVDLEMWKEEFTEKETAVDLFIAYNMVRNDDRRDGVRDFTELENAWDVIKSFEVEIAKIINQGDMEALEEFCKIIESGDRRARYEFLEKWV